MENINSSVQATEPFWNNGPFWIGVGVIATLIGIIFATGKWVGTRQAFETTVTDFMDEIRKSINKIFHALPPQAAIAGASPLRLTEFGQKLSDYMDAPTWAQEIATRIHSNIKNSSNYGVQQYCFEYVSQRKYDPSTDFIRKIEDCAFNHATTTEEVERALAVVLRDEILNWRATEPADS